MHIIGLGNELRGDDGTGLEAVRLIRATPPGTGVEPITVCARSGDPLGLIDIWCRAPAVVLIDAMHSGAPPGVIRRLDAGQGPLPVALGRSCTTHAAGLDEVIELARALDRLPPRLIVYAVEGRRFDAGANLSGPVRAALPALVARVKAEARRLLVTRVAAPGDTADRPCSSPQPTSGGGADAGSMTST